MAGLTLTTFLTLDRVMQAPDGLGEDESRGSPHGGWLIPHADAEMGTTMVEVFSKADALLLGRTTYDIFAAYWPKVTGTADPIPNELHSLPEFVASHTRTSFSGNETTSDSRIQISEFESPAFEPFSMRRLSHGPKESFCARSRQPNAAQKTIPRRSVVSLLETHPSDQWSRDEAVTNQCCNPPEHLQEPQRALWPQLRRRT